MKMEGPMTLLDPDGMHVDEGSEKHWKLCQMQ